MELIRGIHNIQWHHKDGCVLSIGNFDGVHLGHQQVLSKLLVQAKKLSLPTVVMTFEPQPMEFFAKQSAPARLTRLRDKYVQLEKCHIDYLLCVNFNQEFANLTAEDFIRELLVKRLKVKFLVVGDDFCFGKDRKGNFDSLLVAGKKLGFEVVNTQSFCLATETGDDGVSSVKQHSPMNELLSTKANVLTRVSSTAIRQALNQDKLQEAARMLGRDYSINGRVAHGRKLGRTIGFPTANIPLKRNVSPVSGVYVVKVKGAKEAVELGGVANIGNRPTINGIRQQLEVHLFDFKQNLYGKQLEVVLLHKLRDEQKFDSLELLQKQIKLDAQAARVWLLEHNTFSDPLNEEIC